MSEWLSMDDIAADFGVDASTVRHWRSRGVLPDPDLVFGPRRLLWRRSTIRGWRPVDRRRRS